MRKWLYCLISLMTVPLIALGQAATQSVPIGILDPVSMVAYDKAGTFKFLSIDQNGNLIAGGSGIGQTTSGPYGYVAPVAPVAIDPSGNWQFLHVDQNGNLQTTGVSGSGGGDTGGTGGTTFIGGTLTQPLYLASNPTTALQAATKAYVDQAVSGVAIPSNPTFQNVSANQLTLSGALNAASSTIAGTLTTNDIQSGTGTFSGVLSAASATVTGNLGVGGTGTFNALAASSLSVASITYTGSGAFIFGGNPQTADPTGSTFTYPVAYFGPDQTFRTMNTSKVVRTLGDAVTINGGTVPVSAPCLGTNSLGQMISASCSGGAGSMVYPGAGVPVSNGTSWLTSLAVPTSALVGISDSQTISNKLSVTAGWFNATTATTGYEIAGVGVLQSDSQSIYLKPITTTGGVYAQTAAAVWSETFPTGQFDLHAPASTARYTINNTASLASPSANVWYCGNGSATDRSCLFNIGSLNISGLTASQLVGTDASKNLVSLAGISAAQVTSGNLNIAQMPTLPANALFGTLSSTATQEVDVPSCSDTGDALGWQSGVGFICTTPFSFNTPQTYINLVDDFIGGQGSSSGNIGELSWIAKTIGASAPAYVQASDPTYIGEQKITTAAVANTGAQMYLGTSGTFQLGASSFSNANMQSTWIFKLSTVTSGAYRIGFQTVFSTGAVPTTGLYARFDTSLGDPDWMMCATNGGTESCFRFGDGSVQANVWYTLVINYGINKTGFTINGGNETGTWFLCNSGQINCNVVTMPTGFVSPALTIAATTATAVSVYVDLFHLTMNLSR